MPFQSKSQRAYLFANNPKVAKEFATHTPNEKALPEHKHKAMEHLQAMRFKKKNKGRHMFA